MSSKVLENVNMGCTWTSYIAGVYGVLKGAGLWDEEIYKLMGMSGMGFRFVIDKSVCASSATVYDWVTEHFMAMDRIGVHSDFYSITNDPSLNTFGKIQQDAINRIKESIDGGIGVVAWAPTYVLEFGIIKGYDDDDGVFIVEGCGPAESDPLIYTNLGRSDVPMLSYQIFKGRVDVDREKIFRNSLQYGVNEWNKQYHSSPEYGVGRKAYDNLISALEGGNFNDFGLAYLLAVYADSKDNIARYADYVSSCSKTIGGLEKPAHKFAATADLYKKMADLAPFSGVNGRGCSVDRKNISEIINLAKECRELENDAMNAIEKALHP